MYFLCLRKLTNEIQDKIGFFDENDPAKDGARLNVDSKPLVDSPQWNSDATKVTSQLNPDLNQDGIVNMTDIEIVARAFGCQSGSQAWNTQYDANHDGQVNMQDIGLIAALLE